MRLIEESSLKKFVLSQNKMLEERDGAANLYKSPMDKHWGEKNLERALLYQLLPQTTNVSSKSVRNQML